MIQDRKYQTEFRETTLTEYDKGVRRMLASSATGTGKTIMFSQLYENLKSRLPGQMLVLAHREELIDQNIEKMRSVNPEIRVDKEMAEHKADPSLADVIIASVSTLGRKGTKRVENYNWDRVDKLIIDEAHHSTADSYGRVIDLFGALQPSTSKLLLGLTATPQRSDGQALAKLYEKVTFVYSLRQAIEDGWLVDIRGYRVATDTDLSDVKKTGGDFAQGELEDRVNNPLRNQRVVKAWQKLAEDRPTVAFCAGIKHAQDLAQAFNDAGVRASAVWGDDPLRATKLAAHKAGDFKVLCNCAVLTEGYDDWRISCVLLARPTQSGVLFTQMVGRGTRLQEPYGNLKEYLKYYDGLAQELDKTFNADTTKDLLKDIKRDCIVIDVVDNSSKHSLITLPTLMGLPGTLDLRGKSLVYAVQTIEEAQEKHPNADFNKLAAITDLDKFISQINLFEVRFPAEVEENSELTWYKSAIGGYRINIPKDACDLNGGHVSIFQNMLGQWEIEGVIGEGRFRGTGSQMESAFKVCDEQIRKRAPYILNVISRNAKWNGKEISEAQKTMLKRLFPFRTFPADLTRGQASRIIGERIARKAKR